MKPYFIGFGLIFIGFVSGYCMAALRFAALLKDIRDWWDD